MQERDNDGAAIHDKSANGRSVDQRVLENGFDIASLEMKNMHLIVDNALRPNVQSLGVGRQSSVSDRGSVQSIAKAPPIAREQSNTSSSGNQRTRRSSSSQLMDAQPRDKDTSWELPLAVDPHSGSWMALPKIRNLYESCFSSCASRASIIVNAPYLVHAGRAIGE
eukprot:6212598-Pleurochrysis_carterae.AAC.3